MINPVRTFLEKRRRELRSEIENLRDRLAHAEGELADLDQAIAAIGVVNGLDSSTPNEARRAPTGTIQAGTIKDYIVQVLADRPEGLVALDILAEINRRFGTSYVRTSLSPQLSRLGQAGIVKREGLVWRLATRAPPAGGRGVR